METSDSSVYSRQSSAYRWIANILAALVLLSAIAALVFGLYAWFHYR